MRPPTGPSHEADIPAQGVRAAAAIVNYLTANIPESVKLLRDLRGYVVSNFLILDEITRVNLELVATAQGERRGSLLAILDRTPNCHRRAPIAPVAALSVARQNGDSRPL